MNIKTPFSMNSDTAPLSRNTNSHKEQDNL